MNCVVPETIGNHAFRHQALGETVRLDGNREDDTLMAFPGGR